MNIKAITAFGLGLSLLLSTSMAWAQSDPDAMPASPTPDGTMTPEAAPPEAAPPEEPITPEAAPPEEPITPETTSPAESTESDANVDAEGTKLVVCGPNGSATIAMTVRPGCHHLTVNSPPGVL